MFTERKIQKCPASEHCLGMSKFAESPFSMISAHAGMSCSVEWDSFHHHVNANFIDASAAVLLCGHDFLCPLHVRSEQIHCERVLPVSYCFHKCIYIFILVWNYREQRAEQLVLNDIFIWSNRENNSRREP